MKTEEEINKYRKFYQNKLDEFKPYFEGASDPLSIQLKQEFRTTVETLDWVLSKS